MKALSNDARLSPKNSPSVVSPQHPFWSMAFRPFFLLAAISSVISITVWALSLSNKIEFPVQHISPSIWHLHEMLFGFGAACALGFLLTAVQTWTGLRSAHGTQLIALSLLWLAARIALALGAIELTIIIQSAWWLACIALFTRLLIKSRSIRNYQFAPLLFVMACFSAILLLSEGYGRSDLALHFGRTMVLLFCVLVSIIGGRIIPLFTRNATNSKKIRSNQLLDSVILVTSLLGTLVFFLSEFLALPFSPAVLMFAAGILHLYRLSRWDSLATRSMPLLWSLHASYFLMGVGLILLGLSYVKSTIPFSNALHLIAIGTIGSMILGMISRVSLGHTGRSLEAPRIISTAFVLILLAAFVRSFLPLTGMILEAWIISAALWSLSFLLYVIHYFPILTQARQS